MLVQFTIVTLFLVLIIFYEIFLTYSAVKEYKNNIFKKYFSLCLSVITILLIIFIMYICWFGFYHPDMTVYEFTRTII